MITISENAVKELDEFFTDKEKSPIRIYLAPGGCSGPRLALALDAPGDDDKVEEIGNYTFCIEKDLFEATGDITIDLSYMGFSIESANPLAGGGGCGCSGCGSSAGCGSAQ
ncbi:IscA/HesB family protein [Desulfovibrio sp. OttesenSCG-928-O18]|nr:IscA/HesB family protein [Desulfovibrio sp. OttesenSCG-928-O18]